MEPDEGENPMEKNIPAQGWNLRDLFPLFCGCEDCRPGHAYGPAVRGYYLMHYVRSGGGTFSSGGRESRLSEGQCFLIRPNEITFYRADPRDPWHYVWIAFGGEMAPVLLRSAKLDGISVFENARVSALFEGLFRQMADGELDGEKNELGMLSFLYALFAAFPQSMPAAGQRERYVRKVKNYVTKMASNPIPVSRLAGYCGLDRHYLCRIFKKETGQTLQGYVLGYKMDRAKELLLSSSLSVGDIARSVGYADVYNFSKLFKKHFGASPKKLREARFAQN